MDISNLIEEIRVFPLEEVEGSMLGDVDKVLLTDRHLFVFDKVETRKIVVYDSNGRFLKELDLIGDGPFAVNWITDCWLNNEGNLEIYDSYSARVLTFDHELNIQHTKGIRDGFGFTRMISTTPDQQAMLASRDIMDQMASLSNWLFLKTTWWSKRLCSLLNPL